MTTPATLQVYLDVYHRDGTYLTTRKNGEVVSFTDTRIIDMDKYKDLIGDGQARVNSSLHLKIPGPDYSSISVGASVTFSCDQRETTVAETHQIATELCLEFVSTSIPTAMALLEHSIEEFTTEEESFS